MRNGESYTNSVHVCVYVCVHSCMRLFCWCLLENERLVNRVILRRHEDRSVPYNKETKSMPEEDCRAKSCSQSTPSHLFLGKSHSSVAKTVCLKKTKYKDDTIRGASIAKNKRVTVCPDVTAWVKQDSSTNRPPQFINLLLCTINGHMLWSPTSIVVI